MTNKVLILLGASALLAGVAWVVGWGTHALLDDPADRPRSLTATFVSSPAGSSGTSTPWPPTLLVATNSASPVTSSTPAFTSTPAPTLTPLSPQEVETVKQNEGLYQVCRRHCPGRWADHAIPRDLVQYARETARLNGLGWPEPQLDPGQTLHMPPCPDF